MNTIQLDMFSPLYYSTLGYDEELINYLTFIEDGYIRNLFPRPVPDGTGRPPCDPVVLFRMHFLYFTRPEFVSFRQMCKELKKPKHQDYRNFLGIKGTQVPSHSALSRFRKELGNEKNKKQFAKLQSGFINQASQIEGFLNLQIGSLDSRPVYAGVGGFKKECACQNPGQCNCPPRFSDPDAKVGRQRLKVNQNKYFVGYRKNTIICPSSQGPMPLASVVPNAKKNDNNMLIPSLKALKELGVLLSYLITDMGYLDGQNKVTAMKDFSTAVVTEVKQNMIVPETCDSKGRVQCPEGHLAIFDGFDKETLTVTYCGDITKCQSCPRYGVCGREFNFSFEENPHFYGPVGQGSELQARMLKFRKQSELNFALESNLLDNVFHHKKLRIKGKKRVETYLRLADTCRLILGMIRHAEEHLVPKGRHNLLRRLAQQAIYEWVAAREKIA